MTERQTDSAATTELLAALDELYPLADDAKRTERAGRTAFVVKRWMNQAFEEMVPLVANRLRPPLYADRAPCSKCHEVYQHTEWCDGKP